MVTTISLSSTECAYVAAHRDLLAVLGDCTKFVTSAHATQLESLEAQLTEQQIEKCKRLAERI